MQPARSADQPDRFHPLVWLGLIVAIGALLRALWLGQSYFWYDEALILDVDQIFRPAARYIRKVWAGTTYNPGWPLLIWTIVNGLGDHLVLARLPSFLCGTLAIPATYWAARSARLDRPTALLAALFMALSWHQIRHSRQILPYAPVPLLALVCLALLAKIDQARAAGNGRRFGGLHLALVGTSALFVSIHNSFILLGPVIGAFLLASAWLGRPGRTNDERRTDPITPDPDRVGLLRSLLWAAGSLTAIALVSLVFVLPKQGDGMREYLTGFYPPTFRDATTCWQPPVDRADALYRSWRTNPSVIWDVAYFFVTRTTDWVLVNLDPWPTPVVPDTLASLPLAGLFLAGTWVLVSGRTGRTAALAMGSGLIGLGAAFLLSTRKLYPYGGLRHLLPLTPWLMIATAAGARRLFARWPRATVGLMACLVVTFVCGAPRFYRLERAVVTRSKLQELLQRSGADAVVAGDCHWSHACLRYFGRPFARFVPVIDPPFGQFDRLVGSQRPFLLVTFGPSPLDRTPGGWRLGVPFLMYRPNGFDLAKYTVEPLLQVDEPWLVQPVYVFALRPRHAVFRSAGVGPGADAGGESLAMTRTPKRK